MIAEPAVKRLGDSSRNPNREASAKTILAVDPGTQNLQLAVFVGSSKDSIVLISEETLSPGKSLKAVIGAAIYVAGKAVSSNVDIVLVEDQPHVRGWDPSVVYWNGVVESAVCTALEAAVLSWRTVSPSAAKKKADISEGNYWANKEASLKFCQSTCLNKPWLGSNHHVSDCFLLAHYYFATEKI